MFITQYFLVVLWATLALCEHHPFSDEYIAEINRKQSTWKAGKNFEIEEWGKFVRMASGLRRDPVSWRKLKHVEHDEKQVIPEFYDLRKVYPECVSIGEIYDQANCGSCYVFCATEVMADRICIKSKQRKRVFVSPQDALECCPSCGNCNGGDETAVYQYWATQGLTSGGRYNRTDEGCKPYFLPECGHNCPTTTAIVPQCKRECASTNVDYVAEKTYGDAVVHMFRNETQIQLEMLKNGPVSTIFLVAADFGTYQSGIYQVTTDKIVGSHCLKIVGWGNQNGLKYWIIANSWGKAWGEDGYFRIIRGRNESGIEGAASSSLPLDLSFNQN